MCGVQNILKVITYFRTYIHTYTLASHYDTQTQYHYIHNSLPTRTHIHLNIHPPVSYTASHVEGRSQQIHEYNVYSSMNGCPPPPYYLPAPHSMNLHTEIHTDKVTYDTDEYLHYKKNRATKYASMNNCMLATHTSLASSLSANSCSRSVRSAVK